MLTQLSPKTRPVHPKAFAQAKELQQLLMDAAREPECTGPALAQVARAWSELEERKRIIKMKPAPKPIDVSGLRGRAHAGRGRSSGPLILDVQPQVTSQVQPTPGPEPPAA